VGGSEFCDEFLHFKVSRTQSLLSLATDDILYTVEVRGVAESYQASIE